MMPLSDELADLQARMSWFRRVALHVHSPASYDWGQRSDLPDDHRQQLLTDPSPYLKCLTQYDLVAVTDHMRTSFACRYCGGQGDCMVLPGMELTVRLAPPLDSMLMHFLAVFPERWQQDEIGRLFHGLDLPGEAKRDGSEIMDVPSLDDLAARVHDAGGVLIAAHIDGGKGHRTAFRAAGAGALELVCEAGELDTRSRQLCASYKESLARSGIDAIEISRPADAEHYRFTLGEQAVEIATVLRNDAHSLDELRNGPCTYMRMTDASFSGLRQALRFPDTRIRHAAPQDNLPAVVGVRVSGSEQLMGSVTIGFSPNLTCIVGARGSGKSALVDALRYTFGYNKDLGTGIEKDLADQVRARQEATLGGATVEVVYKTSANEPYMLTATYAPKADYSTAVYDAESRPKHVANVERDGRFPCRLYGWNEIERLGRDVTRQRALVDRVRDLHGQLAAREALVTQLRAQRTHIKSLATALDGTYTQSKYLQRLKEFEADFELVKQPEVEELFKQVDAAQAKLTTANQWLVKIHKWQQSVAEHIPFPELGEDEALKALWAALGGASLAAELGPLAARVVAIAGELDDKAHSLVRECTAQLDAATELLTSQLSGKGDVASVARKRSGITDSLAKAQEERRVYEGALAEITHELELRANLVAELRELVIGLSRARQEGVLQINGSLADHRPAIRVTARPEHDSAMHEAWLKAAMKQTHYRTRERLIAAARDTYGFYGVVPALLSRAIPGDAPIADDLEANLVLAMCPFSEDGSSGVRRPNAARLDTLLVGDECWVDDVVEITLDGRPVEVLSPGQKCSALLPVIVLGSNVPLVIDQPEDNLDNQLVTELVIDILRQLKEKRQIIVVTHNPNIVVSGDAEQVVVMDYVDERCRVRRQGSIDHPEVMRDVVELMEGGREAFLRRFRRYWPGQEDVRLREILEASSG